MARVSVTYENNIAHVRLTRADKMNAVDQEMISAVIAAGEDVATSQARVVILSGEGKAFCAGIDITGLSTMIGQDPSELLMPRTHGAGPDGANTTNQWQEFAMVWARMDIPVIAAVHGACFGAGIQLALGADILARGEICGDGDEMGHRAGHGRDGSAAPVGAGGRAAAIDLYGGAGGSRAGGALGAGNGDCG